MSIQNIITHTAEKMKRKIHKKAKGMKYEHFDIRKITGTLNKIFCKDKKLWLIDRIEVFNYFHNKGWVGKCDKNDSEKLNNKNQSISCRT